MLKSAAIVTVLAAAAVGCGHRSPPTEDAAATAPSRVHLKTEPCPTQRRAGRAAHPPPAMTVACLGAPGRVELRALRNTVVNVWASWCPPCREELPRLQAAHRRWGPTIGILGVDTRDQPSIAAAFLLAHGVTYPQAVDTGGQLPARLGSPGRPVTIAIDGTGSIVYRHVGQLSSADVDEIQHRLTRR